MKDRASLGCLKNIAGSLSHSIARRQSTPVLRNYIGDPLPLFVSPSTITAPLTSGSRLTIESRLSIKSRETINSRLSIKSRLSIDSRLTGSWLLTSDWFTRLEPQGSKLGRRVGLLLTFVLVAPSAGIVGPICNDHLPRSAVLYIFIPSLDRNALYPWFVYAVELAGPKRVWICS